MIIIGQSVNTMSDLLILPCIICGEMRLDFAIHINSRQVPVFSSMGCHYAKRVNFPISILTKLKCG